MGVIDEVKERLAYLTGLEKEITKKIRHYPKGKLRYSKGKRGVQYYWVLKGETSRFGRYINKANSQKIQELAQKDYETELLTKCKKESNELRKILKHYEEGLPEKVYGNLPDIRKKLVNSYFSKNNKEELIRQWIEEPYEHYDVDFGTAVFLNEKGEKVRSKSELVLSMILQANKIPYKYEKALYLDGYGTVRPDFTILNLKTMEENYHEHFGIMDNPEYLEKTLEKIEAYAKNGYLLGDKLTVTFESGTHPFDVNAAERMLKEHYLD